MVVAWYPVSFVDETTNGLSSIGSSFFVSGTNAVGCARLCVTAINPNVRAILPKARKRLASRHVPDATAGGGVAVEHATNVGDVNLTSEPKGDMGMNGGVGSEI